MISSSPLMLTRASGGDQSGGYMQRVLRVLLLCGLAGSILLSAAAPSYAGFSGWYSYAANYSCGQYAINLTPNPDTLDKTYDKGWKGYGGGPTTMVFQHIAYSSVDGRMYVYGPSGPRPVPNSTTQTTNVYALPNLPVQHSSMWLEHQLFVDNERRPYNYRRFGTDNWTGCTQAGLTTAYDSQLGFNTSFPASAPYIPLP